MLNLGAVRPTYEVGHLGIVVLAGDVVQEPQLTEVELLHRAVKLIPQALKLPSFLRGCMAGLHVNMETCLHFLNVVACNQCSLLARGRRLLLFKVEALINTTP